MASIVWHLRVDEDIKEDFAMRCNDLGVESNNMLRELIEAFAERRVQIIPTNEQKKKGELYVTGE